MNRSRIVLAAYVLAVSLGALVGVALASTSGEGIHDDARPATLATGVTPDGDAYTISRVDPNDGSIPRTSTRPIPDDVLCFDIASDAARGGGCLPPPDPGSGARSAVVLLGDDMFVIALARQGISRITVDAGAGLGSATSEPARRLGSLNLAHAVLAAPAERMARDRDGLVELPGIELSTTDDGGRTITTEAVVVPAGD